MGHGLWPNQPLGIPAINATVILNDAATGLPTAIIDGGPITARRTAAVSGVAIQHWAPQTDGRPTRVTIIGAGVQGHSHLEMIGHVVPGCSLTLFDRSTEGCRPPRRRRTGHRWHRRCHRRSGSARGHP